MSPTYVKTAASNPTRVGQEFHFPLASAGGPPYTGSFR